MDVFCNPGLFNAAGNSRITLSCIDRATLPDGRNILPVKLAEAFGFGRENPTGMSDLALSSPDGESKRPVGKGECLGNPKGKLVGAAFFWLLFFGQSKKSNSPARRNQM